MPVDEDTAARLAELTRLAREGDQAAASSRDELLATLDARLHVREDDDGATLVIYPTDWVADSGRVDPSAIDDHETAIERSLDGPASDDQTDWAAIDAHNQAIATAVADRHGPVHGETAAALATYLGNHHLQRIEEATERQLETFRREYFVRNAWPSAEQQALLDRSIALTLAVAREQST